MFLSCWNLSIELRPFLFDPPSDYLGLDYPDYLPLPLELDRRPFTHNVSPDSDNRLVGYQDAVGANRGRLYGFLHLKAFNS